MENILITHILPKLPPKSLMRFKCVQKLWKSIISHPSFNISLEHNGHALAISADSAILYKIMYEKLSNTIPLHLENVAEEIQRAPLPKIDMILGRCNGLILFSEDVDIFLWNPCTSYCQKVLELDNLTDCVYSVVSGFCYDTSSDDYIVILTFRQLSPGWHLPVISAALKTKKWKRVTFPYDVDSVVSNVLCIVNNQLHWLASPRRSINQLGELLLENPKIIIYFDAPSNTFNMLPSPDPIVKEGDDLVGLGVLEGLVCVMRVNRCDVEVFVMKEYGVKESWTPMCCLQDVIPWEGKYLRAELVLCSLKFDILLFGVDGKLHAYYPSSRRMVEAVGWGLMSPCVVSLVSPFDEYYWNEKYHKKIASTTAKQALDF